MVDVHVNVTVPACFASVADDVKVTAAAGVGAVLPPPPVPPPELPPPPQADKPRTAIRDKIRAAACFMGYSLHLDPEVAEL